MAIKMLILQVPPSLLIHKMATNTPAGQPLYSTLSLHIYGGRQMYLYRDIKKKQ